jgi:hypothetical protein
LAARYTEGMKPGVLSPSAKDLYDQDFFEWTVRNAELLRARRFDEADVDRIAEELEDMGKREKNELASRLRVLLTHLLKWQIQTERRSGSWKATLRTQRREIGKLLAGMPSLRRSLRGDLPEVYEDAASDAVGETGLPRKSFAPACPFDLEQILDTEYYPD